MNQHGYDPFVAVVSGMGRQIMAFLPPLLAIALIVLLSLLGAFLLEWAVLRMLRVVRFNDVSARAGLARALRRGGVGDVTAVVGQTAYWTGLVLFVLVGLGTLNIEAADRLVQQIVGIMIRMLVAAVILAAGFLLGNFAGRATLISAVNAGLPQARFLARGVRLAIMLLALAMAFEQLGVAPAVIVAAFSIAFGGVALALAIAFGLGGRHAARAIVDRWVGWDRAQDDKEEDFSHL